jgi:hypothetical protein
LLEYELGLRCWREISELKSFTTIELYADVTSQAIQGLKSLLDDLKFERLMNIKKFSN